MKHDTQQMLAAMQHGDEALAERVMARLYDELRAIAGAAMCRERAEHTLQPTALVHEAFLKLRSATQIEWRGREHFCGVAAHVMRNVLIDHARQRLAAKRGGRTGRISLENVETPLGPGSTLDLLALDEALTALADLQPRHAQVVEMRFFAGMTIEETATALDASTTTVKADWRMARAWLKSQLADDS
jgi:RNA polymerase sigma-70 factor, ECF subfamily